MKRSLFFKQSKPLTVSILGITISLLSLFSGYNEEGEWNQIAILLVIGLVLLSYSIAIEIVECGVNIRHFKVLGWSVFKQKLDWDTPDYITVFRSLLKQNSDWGPISALGKQRGASVFVIRCFKGNKHFTIWKTNSLESANTKAKELGRLLNVEVKLGR